MIKYNPKSWASLIFDVYSRYVFKSLLPLILFMGIFSTAYVAIVVDLAQLHYESTIQFHSIIGVMLGLFWSLESIPLMIVGGKEENYGEN